MTLLIYLFKTILISAALYGYYWLWLRNRSFHAYNRWFLMGIPVISLLLPALQLKLPSFWNQQVGGSPIRLLGVGQGTLEEAVTVYARQGFWRNLPLETICLAIGLLVSLFFFIRFYRALHNIRSLRLQYPYRELQGAKVYFVSEEGTPFSFFNHIFWNEELELDSLNGRQIFRHEIYHVRHKHSVDILLLEILRMFCWFNPFMHLIRREIQAVHEFLADAYAATEADRLEYAELLLMKSACSSSIPMTHPFFQNQIKRRITMMTDFEKIKSRLWSRMMILPVIALLLGLFAFKLQHPSNLLFPSPKAIRVVVDAGHGGLDGGVMVNGIQEKDINLRIAKKIQQMAKDYNIEVIMTRENDVLPGPDNNIKDALHYRAALPAKENADLFVSIHTNGDADAVSGFEIYVPDNSSAVYSESVKLGSGISGYIQNHFSIAPELKQRTSPNIWVLHHATVPAILIECGNIDKKSDLDFIMQDANQEKIAGDILAGIRQYSLQTSSFQESLPPADTISTDAMNKLDPNTIFSMDVNKISNRITRITIRFKDGRESIVLITDEMKNPWKNASDTTKPTFTKIFTKVEMESEYPGGQTGWGQYLIKNLKYPPEAVKKEIQGDVVVQFIVEADGRLTDIHAESGPEALRSESERVIRESGKWIPAKQNGRIVRAYKKQPIIYRLKSS